MDKFMILSKVNHKNYMMYCVVMKQNGRLPDQSPKVKDAIRRLVLFLQATYTEGLENLHWVYGGHPEPEQQLVKWISSQEWELLFGNDPTAGPIAFKGLVGESLAYWAARKLKGCPIVTPIRPGGSDPAFDLVALEPDAAGYVIRWIQAKGTQVNYRRSAAIAVRKFKKLEDGEYSAQVANTLHYLAAEAKVNGVKIEHQELRKIQLVPDTRRYTVFILHDGKLVGNLMTQYKKYVPGSKERREAIFMRLADVQQFLQEMEAAIRANIS